MATHSSDLAWQIPWTEEPGRLQSMGLWRVGHDCRTRLSYFTFTFHFHALEQEMATHSSVLAWRIPGTGKPGWLLSMGLHRVRHDWSNLAVAADLQSSFSNVCKYQSVVVHLKLISCLCQLYFSLKKEIEGISFPPQAPRNGHVRT